MKYREVIVSFYENTEYISWLRCGRCLEALTCHYAHFLHNVMPFCKNVPWLHGDVSFARDLFMHKLVHLFMFDLCTKDVHKSLKIAIF